MMHTTTNPLADVHEHLGEAMLALARAVPTLSHDTAALALLARLLTEAQSQLATLTRDRRDAAALAQTSKAP